MDISTYFYPKEKVDVFEAEVNKIAEIADTGERLMAYQELYSSYPAKRYANAMGRVMQDFGYMSLALLPVALMIPVAFVATPLVALATLMPLSLAGLAVGMSYATGRFGRLHDKMYNALKRDEQSITLEALRQSPKFDAVLAAFPQIKERFQQAAVAALIKSSVEPVALPAPRLQLAKHVQPGTVA